MYTLNFGLVGLGNITETFAKDILSNPADRNVKDVKHNLVAAGSSSKEKADDFLKKVNATNATGYGSYEEVYNDKNVDIIYIGTPHSHHYKNAKDALNAGKHVLVEKPATVTYKQMEKLVAIAKEKKRFLMEAKWTRFFPMLKSIVKVLQDGVIGDIKQINADFGQTFYGLSADHRIFNRNLAGGSQMDLMPYPLIWVLSILFFHPLNNKSIPTVSGATCIKNEHGVDELTTALLKFDKIDVDAIVSTNICIGSISTLIVRGTKGELIIHELPLSRPTYYEIRTRDVNNPSPDDQSRQISRYDFPIPNHGMHWEADEAARVIGNGKIESDTVTWEESLVTAKIMDEIRAKSGNVFPSSVEEL